MSDKESSMPIWGLPALSWIVSIYFLLGFTSNVGFPPDRQLMAGDAVYVGLWLLFLFLPFLKRIKIGALLELEREVARTKEEIREFKHDVRNTLSVLSTNINTIGGMSNQVTVNIPGIAQLRAAREDVESNSPPQVKETATQEEDRILQQSEDKILALARTRIEIEGLLRMLVRKSKTFSEDGEIPIKYAGINKLFQMYLAENRDVAFLQVPFKYVTQVCNAAIHAQTVSDGQADEALALGAQIIAVLKDSLPQD